MATECISCNYEASKDEGRVVGTVTGDYGPICNECWALLLHDETVLSDRESDVAALRDMDLPPFEIADILGLEESTVYTYIGRIHDKVERAHRTVDEIGHMTVER